MVFIVAYGWGWWFVTPAWCGVQGLGFSGLIIGVFVERVGDLVCDVFAGGGVDVDGGDGFGLGGVGFGGEGFLSSGGVGVPRLVFLAVFQPGRLSYCSARLLRSAVMSSGAAL